MYLFAVTGSHVVHVFGDTTSSAKTKASHNNGLHNGPAPVWCQGMASCHCLDEAIEGRWPVKATLGARRINSIFKEKMRKNVALLSVLAVLLCACGTKESTATPVDVSALQTAAVQTVIAAANQKATANASTNVPKPTLTPTSTLVEGWLTYSNAVLRYELSYPPEAILVTEGVTGYPTEELPPNMTGEEYLAMLKQHYPGDLCVSIQYRIGYIAMQAPPEQGGKYSLPCGLSGLGVVDVIQKTEPAIIDGRSYSAIGYEVHQRDAAATFVGEYFTLQLEDGTVIHYGGFWTAQGQMLEDYLPVKDILLQILASYRSD